MLARIDAIDGVIEARVEVTGRHFVVRFTPGADVDALSALVLQALGPGSVRVDPPWNASELGSYGRGELWLCHATIRTLSLIEARIAAVQMGSTAAKAAGLDSREAFVLQEALHQELVAEFEKIHDAGGDPPPQWWIPGFKAAIARALDKVEWFGSKELEEIRGALAA